jgi:hypothetical protein
MPLILIILYVRFFACTKKRTSSEAAKKVQPEHSPLCCWPSATLRCSKKRTLRKVVKFIPPCGVLRRIVFPIFAVLLGGVKWQNKNMSRQITL